LKTLKAHLALIGANLIYGINYSVAKDVMPAYIQPFGFILLRVIGAVILFWSVAAFLKTKPIDKKDWPRLVLGGMFGVAINQMLFFKGLCITQPINAAIVMTSTPILVLVVSSVVLKERITTKKLIGIFLGLLGAFVLIAAPTSLLAFDFEFNSNTALGDLLVLINATSYGVYLIIIKPLMQKYEPIAVVKWVFLFGFFMVFPFGIQEAVAIQWSTMPTKIVLEMTFVIVGTTFFAYLFNIFALKELNPTVVSVYIYSQPFFATIVALAMGSDTINLIKITAAALVFTGVFLVSFSGVGKTSN